ncbi:unnamed protein product [Calypogeia fissa]
MKCEERSTKIQKGLERTDLQKLGIKLLGSKKHCWSSDSRATTHTIDPNNPRFPPLVYSTELKVFISSSPHTAKSFNTVRDVAGLEVSSRTGEIYCGNAYSTVRNDRTIGGMRRLRDDESPSSNLRRLSPPGPQDTSSGSSSTNNSRDQLKIHRHVCVAVLQQELRFPPAVQSSGRDSVCVTLCCSDKLRWVHVDAGVPSRLGWTGYWIEEMVSFWKHREGPDTDGNLTAIVLFGVNSKPCFS